MKAVMYHYVREYDSEYPNFKFLHVNDFKKQLDYFEKRFEILRPGEWESIVAGQKECVENSLLLTFDDGLADHYNYVFSELKKRDFAGVFFVPTQPLKSVTLLDVHQIHVLLGKIDADELQEQVKSLVTSDMVPDLRRSEFRELTYVEQKNRDSVNYVKRTLNYFIDYRFRSGVLAELFTRNKIEMPAERFYLSSLQIREMHAQGMVIGSHSVSHPVLSKLSESAQREEIRNSFGDLENIVGRFRLKSFCYPYGGDYSFNSDTVRILNEESVDCSFSVESRDIQASDLTDHYQRLPRYDCNEFPFGSVFRKE